jgi:2-amino-4,5-dihydroxy-6-oxo-7-(phosphonooxy)heptanoate synthase
MPNNDSFARRLRMRHLYRHDPRGLLVVPLDHAIGAGPLACPVDLDGLIGQIADNGADAVVLHKGALRRIGTRWFRDMSLVLHLTASTGLAPDPDAKYPVATVEEALRLGAEAVSVHVNAGSLTEGRQIADLAAVAESCDRWGMPLIAMMYARGPSIADGRAPGVVAHAAAVAAELGADIVKTALPAATAAIADVTAACPLPVLAAGGSTAGGAAGVLGRMADAIRGGAGGIAAGRLVFTADDPGTMVRRLATLVHDRTPVGSR